MVLSFPDWASLPSLDSVSQGFGRAALRICCCRRPPYICSGAIGTSYALWRILLAKRRGRIRANAPNAERENSLTAPRVAAWEHGTLTLCCALQLRQLSGRRKGDIQDISVGRMLSGWQRVAMWIARAGACSVQTDSRRILRMDARPLCLALLRRSPRASRIPPFFPIKLAVLVAILRGIIGNNLGIVKGGSSK